MQQFCQNNVLKILEYYNQISVVEFIFTKVEGFQPASLLAINFITNIYLDIVQNF